MQFLRRVSRRRLELAAASSAGFAAAFAFAMHGSPPSFRHDWQWPALRQMFGSIAGQKMDAWWWSGFGNPSIAAQLHPLFVLPGLASTLVGPFAILIVLVAFIWAASAWGMVALLRDRFGATGAASFAGAMLYGFAPLVVVKTVAGHVAYLVAYAALPFVLWSVMGTDLTAAAIFASALAVEAVQLQVFAASLVLALVFRRLPWRYVVPAGVLGACTVAPHFWSLLRPGAAVVTHGMLTSRPWELNLSAALLPATLGLGYFEPYWQTATGSAVPLYGLFALLYPIGAVAALALARYPFRRRVTGIYVLGVLLVAGLDGPLAIPLAVAFERIPAVSALRELYDLAVLIVLAGSLGFAELISRIPIRIAWFVAAGVTLVAFSPWLDRGVLCQTDTADTSSALAAQLDKRATAAPLTRFLILPAVNPVGRAGTTWGGADPLAFPYGSLMPLWIYIPSGFDPEYLWLVARGSARIDRNLAISTIVRRFGFTTKELASRALVAGGRSFFTQSRIASPFARAWSDEHVAIYQADAPLPILQLAPRRFGSVSATTVSFESEHGSNPRLAFAPILDFWYLSAELARGASSGIVTFAPEARAQARCSATGAAAAGAVLGDGTIDGRKVHAPVWAPMRIPCGNSLKVVAKPMIALTSIEDLENWDETSRVAGSSRVPLREVARSGDTLTAAAPQCRGCSLVLAERFDPGWVMIGPGNREIVSRDVGGFNEWDVDLSPGDRVRVHYRPAFWLTVATAISGCAWMTIGLALIGVGASARRKSVLRTNPSREPGKERPVEGA